MIRLSRTGWNNVIIISVMSFILIINTLFKDGQAQGDTVAGEQAIVADNAVILSLAINDGFQVERAGRSWRSSSTLMNAHALEQMMLAWQQRTGEVMATAPVLDPQLALTVKVALASQSQPITLALYATDEALFIYHQQRQNWLRLPLPIFSQLVPDAVFASQ